MNKTTVWSDYQKAIFKNVAKEVGHSLVIARAGSGKTSTLVEAVRYIPKNKKVLLVAFNKIIQKELQNRIKSMNCDVLTYHSLGLRAVRQAFGNVVIDEYKGLELAQKALGVDRNDKDAFQLVNNLCQVVSFAKAGLLFTTKEIDDIMDQFGIDSVDLKREDFIKKVFQVLELCKKDKLRLDFDDMIYFPHAFDLNVGKYDFVMTDEAQDLNKSQLIMGKNALKKDGRFIAVLDPKQQLYSWRLADNSVIQEMRNLPGTKTLSLPISYRCPKKVINSVQKWVNDITFPDTAIDGEISDIHTNDLYQKVKPGDFILSRVNAPLLRLCLSFIKLGMKANIRGRDIGEQLAYLIKKSKKKTIDQFVKWLEDWKESEVERLIAKNMKPDAVLDKYDCLMTICEDAESLEDAKKTIKNLFNDTDDKNIIWLSSIHRSKGLEAKNVFILRWTLKFWPSKYHSLDEDNEEGNLWYVSATRAQKHLYYVDQVGKPGMISKGYGQYININDLQENEENKIE